MATISSNGSGGGASNATGGWAGKTWFNSQADRDRLLRGDEDILTFITTLVTSEEFNG